jgi:predicted enzyme related to lactoylglutathione lyase
VHPRIADDAGEIAEIVMPSNIRPGAVVFTGNRDRLVGFYRAVTGFAMRFSDRDITVLGSDQFELVIHVLPTEPAIEHPPPTRTDAYIKPFFPVTSLAEARRRAEEAGGRLRPRNEEWEARGFRACEAVDPDGNVVQFREEAR